MYYVRSGFIGLTFGTLKSVESDSYLWGGTKFVVGWGGYSFAMHVLNFYVAYTAQRYTGFYVRYQEYAIISCHFIGVTDSFSRNTKRITYVIFREVRCLGLLWGFVVFSI